MRFFRVLWYMITGRFNSWADAWASNPHVLASTFDSSISKKEERYKQTKVSLANLIGLEEKKVQKIKTLSSEIEHLEKVKTGAGAKAKHLAQQLQAQGKTIEEIKANSEYLKCQAGFADASSTLKEKEDRVRELEDSIVDGKKLIDQTKLDLQQMQRSRDKLLQEKEETITEIQIAKEQEEAAEARSGIAEDTTDKDLANARKVREQAKAKARVAMEISGNDTTVAENEFLQFAEQSSTNSEFDALLGLDKMQSKEETKQLDPAKLPEN